MKSNKIVAFIVFSFCLLYSSISDCIEQVLEKFIKPLTPPVKSGLVDEAGRPSFALDFNFLSIIRSIYVLDVIERYPPDIIKDILDKAGALKLCEKVGIRFDWDSIHEAGQGYKRVYRFELNGKPLIVRVFDPSDPRHRTFQEENGVKFEIAFPNRKNPRLIIQIIPAETTQDLSLRR